MQKRLIMDEVVTRQANAGMLDGQNEANRRDRRRAGNEKAQSTGLGTGRYTSQSNLKGKNKETLSSQPRPKGGKRKSGEERETQKVEE